MSFNKIALLLCSLALSSTLSAQRIELEDLHRSPEPTIAAASNEAELALQIIQVPNDLEVKLWAAEPMLANPVAITLDEQGRVFVSETYRYHSSTLDIRNYRSMTENDLASRTIEDRLTLINQVFGEQAKDFEIESEVVRLLADTNGDGTADLSSIYRNGFNDPLAGIASGVLARKGDVYFTNIPALTLLQNEVDGKATKRTDLHRGFGVHFGYTGHDMHGLIIGPDGKLYFSIGDRGANLISYEGKHIYSPDRGAVFRCDLDGSNLEIVAKGFRNPQELAFDEYGNLWTFDNDCDNGDIERAVYIVDGIDSGWRIGHQFAPTGKAGMWMAERIWEMRNDEQPAYIVPPNFLIEDGPSGIAYYPGTGLAERYKGSFFVCHFKGSIAGSGIFRYTVKPDGAGFKLGTKERFLSGVLPTDVTFAPDGKMYLSDWTPGWPKQAKGRIYTVSKNSVLNSHIVKETQTLISEGMEKRSTEELTTLLSHIDQRIRTEAQFELSDRGNDSIDVFKSVAFNKHADLLSRLHAIWGLGQLGRHSEESWSSIIKLTKNNNAEVQAQAIKIVGELKLSAALRNLKNATKSKSARVRFFAAQSLGQIGDPSSASYLIKLLRENKDQDLYIRHAASLALSRINNLDAILKFKNDPSDAVRMGAVLALRRLKSPKVAIFLKDSNPKIITEAARAINGENIVPALPALASIITDESANDYFTGLRVLNANYRIGGAANAQALANYAANPNANEALRVEALYHLSNWSKAPDRDRLTGLYQPLPQRASNAAINALLPVLSELIANAPGSVQAKTIDTIELLKLTSSTDDLYAMFKNPESPLTGRVAALKALDTFGDPRVKKATQIATESGFKELRLASVPILAKLAPEESLPLLNILTSKGDGEEQQIAYSVLGKMNHPEADAILIDSMERLTQGILPSMGILELLDAAEQSKNPVLKQSLALYNSTINDNPNPIAPYLFALEGGERRAGRKVFMQHSVMPCARCHTVSGDYNGEPGPSLANIGAEQSREYILEAIIAPNASIAKGFETATITDNSGTTTVGTVSEETGKSLTLKLSDGTTKTFSKSDIKSRSTQMSTMPAIFGSILTKKELRDVVEFLAQAVVVDRGHGE